MQVTWTLILFHIPWFWLTLLPRTGMPTPVTLMTIMMLLWIPGKGFEKIPHAFPRH